MSSIVVIVPAQLMPAFTTVYYTACVCVCAAFSSAVKLSRTGGCSGGDWVPPITSLSGCICPPPVGLIKLDSIWNEGEGIPSPSGVWVFIFISLYIFLCLGNHLSPTYSLHFSETVWWGFRVNNREPIDLYLFPLCVWETAVWTAVHITVVLKPRMQSYGVKQHLGYRYWLKSIRIMQVRIVTYLIKFWRIS